MDLACTAVIVVIPISASARVVGAERSSVENGTRAGLEVDSDSAWSGVAFDLELNFLGSAAGSEAEAEINAAEAEVDAKVEADAEVVGSFVDSSWFLSFCLLFFLLSPELVELEPDLAGDMLMSFIYSMDERQSMGIQKERNIVVEGVRIRNDAEDRKFHSGVAELFTILFLIGLGTSSLCHALLKFFSVSEQVDHLVFLYHN